MNYCNVTANVVQMWNYGMHAHWKWQREGEDYLPDIGKQQLGYEQ